MGKLVSERALVANAVLQMMSEIMIILPSDSLTS
jgi:hypothetical protein